MNQRMLVVFNFANLNNFIIYMDVEVSNNYDKLKLTVLVSNMHIMSPIFYKLEVQF